MLLIVAGAAGRVNVKGAGNEHLSPHTGSDTQAATVRALDPTMEAATSSLIEPSGCAIICGGVHAGPVSL